MKGYCLAVLLCAFVQVQCLTPYVFSARSHYGLLSQSKTLLQDATIVVQFDQAFQDRDCGQGDPCFIIDTSDSNVLIETGVVSIDTTKHTASFTPVVVVPASYSGEVTITISVPAGAFQTVSGSPFSESAPYMVYAAGLLKPLASKPVWKVDSISNTTTVEHVFNRQTYSLTDGHKAGQPYEITVEGSANVRDLMYYHIDNAYGYSAHTEHLNRVCLKAKSIGPILRDIYGNTINGDEGFGEDCIEVELFCGSFSEWSACRYTCTPAEHDLQFNRQTRTRPNINGGECHAPIEERQCETNPGECYVYINSGETGSECEAEGLGCDSDTVAPSGCKCNSDCLETGDCCQSYFKTCVANNDHEDYFYQYAPCWAPKKCGADGLDCEAKYPQHNGACDIADSSPSGQVRPYRYSCACTLNSNNGLFCYNFDGVDRCCGGAANFKSTCQS